jgi:hypothetical protein
VTDPRKAVWILGAGFSRSLGGPMLVDLLSEKAQETISALYPDANSLYRALHAEVVRLVRTVYTAGVKKHYWSDAEEYIDLLDAAAVADEKIDGSGKQFARLILSSGAVDTKSRAKPALDAIRLGARRIIAAECTAFIDVTQPEAERWTPYHDWAKAVSTTDSILTFNYDRVLEILGRFDTLKPGGDFQGRHDHKGMAQVLKLHGSVDWKRTEQAGKVTYETTPNPHYALTCPDAELAIATPGPSKRASTGELQLLWTTAEERLAEADAIVFVGYRFPQTDAEARGRLLRAIEANHARRGSTLPRSHHLFLHVVLGPERQGKDVVRLEGLLREVMNRAGRFRRSPVNDSDTYSLEVHPLYAEDFFTVFSPTRLFRVPTGIPSER